MKGRFEMVWMLITLAALTTVTTPGVAAADLSISQLDSLDPVPLNTLFTYDILVSNSGGAPATSVEVVDSVPNELFIEGYSGTAFSCSHSGQVITCTTASLGAGANETISIYVVATSGRGTITNTVSVTAAEIDPNTANNTSVESTVIGNSAPVGFNDTFNAVEDEPLIVGAPGVLLNDTDPDGDPLTALLESPPTKGSISLASDGSFTFTPRPNEHGTDFFTYFADDGLSRSAETTVTIEIAAVNDPPVAVDDSYSASGQAVLNVPAPGVLSNDDDADGDSLIALLETGPSNGTLQLLSSGSFSYTPGPDASGSDSFTYFASDGMASARATVTIALNSAPVAVDDAYATDENTTVLIQAKDGVLANDTDPEGATLTAILFSQPDKGGTVKLNLDGSFTYIPPKHFPASSVPETEIFSYRVSDGSLLSDPATVTMSVRPTIPVTKPDAYEMREGETLSIAAPGPLGNDYDPSGDPLRFVIDRVSSWKIDLDSSPDGRLKIGFYETVTRTENVVIEYRALDPAGHSAPSTVTITVLPPLQANNDAFSVPIGGSFEKNVLHNDTDINPLRIVSNTQPSAGTATCTPEGICRYTHTGRSAGSDRFSYVVSDGRISANATVVIDISCPSPPQLTYPANDAEISANGQTFSWTPVAAATAYRVMYVRAGATPVELATVNAPVTSYRHSAQLLAGTGEWYVEAFVSGCDRIPSTARSVTVRGRPPCDANKPVPLLATMDPVGGRNVVFIWGANAQGVTKYRVWASIDGAVPRMIGTSTISVTSIPVPAGKRLAWFVEAEYRGCIARSNALEFVIPVPENCPGERPFLLSTLDGARFDQWLVSAPLALPAGATGYRFWIRHNGGMETPSETYPASVTPELLLPTGNFELSAEAAFSNGCFSARSNRVRFTVIPKTVGARIHAPASGAIVTSPVAVRWTRSISGQDPVVIQLRKRGAQTNLGTWSDPSSPFTLPHLEPGEYEISSSYFDLWTGTSFPKINRFTVVKPQCGAPRTTTIEAPRRVASNRRYSVSWKPVTAASSYRVYERDLNTGSEIKHETSQTSWTRQHFGKENALSFFEYRVEAINACLGVVGAPSAPRGVEVGPKTLFSGNPTTLPGNTLLFPARPRDPYEAALSWETDYPDYAFTYATLFPPQAIWGLPFKPKQPQNAGIIVLPGEGVITNPLVIGVGVLRSGFGQGVHQRMTLVNLLQLTKQALDEGAPQTLAIPFLIGDKPLVSEATPSEPPQNALLIPVVVSADAGERAWLSDVEMINMSPYETGYQVTFVPSAGQGEASQFEMTLFPGEVAAFDDVLGSMFLPSGVNASGYLEVRPLDVNQMLPMTVAASRIRQQGEVASLGETVSAIPVENLVRGPDENGNTETLIVPWLSQTTERRTNIGFVEGTGEPVVVELFVYSSDGQLRFDSDVSLGGFEHRQLNALLAAEGIMLESGWAEVRVRSGEGAIASYASIVDSGSGDSDILNAVRDSDVRSTHWIVPGVANYTVSGWMSDLRLLNSTDEMVSVEATLAVSGASISEPVVIELPPRKLTVVTDIVGTLFGLTNAGGALHLRTEAEATIHIVGRTWRNAGEGSYGQTIAAIPADRAVSAESSLWQPMVEETVLRRTNLGIAEVDGHPVTVEISVIGGEVDGASTRVDLAPFEFIQLSRILTRFGVDNDRASLRLTVVEGEGKIVSYTSTIDNTSGDPVYMPGLRP